MPTATIFEESTELEAAALERFRSQYSALFQKNDFKLILHLGIIFLLLIPSVAAVVLTPYLLLKIFLGTINAFLWFSLINVTIHHHHTHHNAAHSPFFRGLLDFIYVLAVPNAPKRRVRYIRAHLNHHARPFHETDVDHNYGTFRYLEMMKRPWTKILYFLELTLVGAHIPGWEDDRYMNQVPLENWSRTDYEAVKGKEIKVAQKTALIQWGLFAILLLVFPAFAWGWSFPMLLVKNWAHFLGQFQHYDERLLDSTRTVANRTRTYRIPGWLNYLAAGEISGHFLHHLFPELPYYNVERARRIFLNDPELSRLFVTL